MSDRDACKMCTVLGDSYFIKGKQFVACQGEKLETREAMGHIRYCFLGVTSFHSYICVNTL